MTAIGRHVRLGVVGVVLLSALAIGVSQRPADAAISLPGQLQCGPGYANVYGPQGDSDYVWVHWYWWNAGLGQWSYLLTDGPQYTQAYTTSGPGSAPPWFWLTGASGYYWAAYAVSYDVRTSQWSAPQLVYTPGGAYYCLAI